MKITIMVDFWNDSYIAPFILNHYRKYDEILALIDDATTDNTEEICKSYPNVIVDKYSMSNGADEIIRIAKINEIYKSISEGWIYVVCSDELIFPPRNVNPYFYLEEAEKSGFAVIPATLYDIYPHRTDINLDTSKPSIPQRIHGIGIVFGFIKPIVIKAGLNIEFQLGTHYITDHDKQLINLNYSDSPIFYYGAHWKMADRNIAQRRFKNFSKNNLENSRGCQDFDITEERINKEFQEHLDDPIISELEWYVP